ncbi:glycoside hydrolase family 2 protein [Fimbriiglobus ruber]|uniref:Beta-galactosidase n=1 Tax=Fimbriiglobus ruber TaxID=1908690 RepID=A0A225DTK9_9BACT|nr:sugar-binding domain-containing protein [Fimbriiglobus ruber]OWK40519.1 Beta-galactosidase [Fimbriiglobus ruber]
MRFLLIGAAVLALSPNVRSADWKPAPTPLTTKWGKQVTPDNVWKEYPRPQLVRKEWQNLNGLWDYAITPKSGDKPDKWDGQILVPFCVESSLSGVGKTVTKDQYLWYHRAVEVPAGWKDQRVLLNFGAVDYETAVFVNGKEIGSHKGGFVPFTLDMTDALKPGANELIVRVWDPTDEGAQPRGKQKLKPEGIWYTPVTGIWQTVWMEPVSKVGSIESLAITTDISRGEVTVRAKMSREFGAAFQVQVLDGDKAVGEESSTDFGCTIKIPDAKLWTPDTPHLYTLRLNVVGMQAGSNYDSAESYFAMRKISVGKDEKGLMRMLLNDKPLFQVGPLDQGWWPDGLLTPPSDEAMAYDLKVLKSVGMNMLRKHIKVEPARLYYHCDKLGLLVWQDMPSAMGAGRKHFVGPGAKDDAEFTTEEKKQFLVELKAMIDHLSFFQSIVVWVPFNEGWGQHDTNDVLKWVKDYDKTRLVDGPSGWQDRGFGDMKDMHNYPGPGMFPPMPDRVSVLGEFGGLGLPIKGHLWKDKDNWGYQSFKTIPELRTAYHTLMLRMHPLIGKGLSAAVYTQTTDVEVEVNGLMTYDREIIKLDPKETMAWHKALFGPAPEEKTLVATSETEAQTWRYTTDKPAAGWEKADFDAGKWAEGPGGFGTRMTPGSVVRTEWKTDDIWIRRSFELKDVPTGEIFLRIHHDEDAAVYINGVLAAKRPGYVSSYYSVPLTPEGRAALKAGKNTIAVHCKQTGGGQYIDVGLVELVPAK